MRASADVRWWLAAAAVLCLGVAATADAQVPDSAAAAIPRVKRGAAAVTDTTAVDRAAEPPLVQPDGLQVLHGRCAGHGLEVGMKGRRAEARFARERRHGQRVGVVAMDTLDGTAYLTEAPTRCERGAQRVALLAGQYAEVDFTQDGWAEHLGFQRTAHGL